MFFIRILLFGIVFYLVYKALSRLLNSSSRRPEVRGTGESKPKLDLKNQDVEDIDFKEMKE